MISGAEAFMSIPSESLAICRAHTRKNRRDTPSTLVGAYSVQHRMYDMVAHYEHEQRFVYEVQRTVNN